MKFNELLHLLLVEEEKKDEINIYYFYFVYYFFEELTKDFEKNLMYTENLRSLDDIWKCVVTNILINNLVPENEYERFYNNIADIEHNDLIFEEENDDLSKAYSLQVDLLIEKYVNQKRSKG